MGRFAKSRLAANLQMVVSKRRLESGLYTEIASLLPLKDNIRLLDVGTGTGLMLRAVHEINPTVELFGLDISSEAIKLANEKLADMKVNLRSGSIEKTDFADNFFNVVTCNASMSYWENPVDCFNEIYRILYPGGQVVLIEPRVEMDVNPVIGMIQENMADKSLLRRWMAIGLNKLGLKSRKCFGKKLYNIKEFEVLIGRSDFSGHGHVSEVSSQQLPLYLKIFLKKPGK